MLWQSAPEAAVRKGAHEGVQGRKGAQGRVRASNAEGGHTLRFFFKIVSQKMIRKSRSYD